MAVHAPLRAFNMREIGIVVVFLWVAIPTIIFVRMLIEGLKDVDK